MRRGVIHEFQRFAQHHQCDPQPSPPLRPFIKLMIMARASDGAVLSHWQSRQRAQSAGGEIKTSFAHRLCECFDDLGSGAALNTFSILKRNVNSPKTMRRNWDTVLSLRRFYCDEIWVTPPNTCSIPTTSPIALLRQSRFADSTQLSAPRPAESSFAQPILCHRS